MQTFNKQIATNVLLNASSISGFVPLKNMFMFSIAFVVTGTPTGTVKLQASNDPETNTTVPLDTPINWVDITGSDATVTAAGEVLWDAHDIAYNYVRVIYTDTSGATSLATANIIFNGKGI